MMKIITIILISVFSHIYTARAAEIFGTISTDPRQLSTFTTSSSPQVRQPSPPASPAIKEVGGGVLFIPQRSSETNENDVSDSSQSLDNTDKQAAVSVQHPQVLGVKLYSSGTLLRGPDKKIYLIEKNTKRYIANLAALAKYRGRRIEDVSFDTLKQYRTKLHGDGELIRQQGTAKVYVIERGSKRHILNIEELRRYYFAREIFNISAEEMRGYEN